MAFCSGSAFRSARVVPDTGYHSAQTYEYRDKDGEGMGAAARQRSS